MMKKVFVLLGFMGFVLMVCAAGASDMEMVSFSQTVSQCVFGGLMMMSGVLGKKAVDRYQRRKKLEQRYYRIQTICSYESEHAA